MALSRSPMHCFQGCEYISPLRRAKETRSRQTPKKLQTFLEKACDMFSPRLVSFLTTETEHLTLTDLVQEREVYLGWWSECVVCLTRLVWPQEQLLSVMLLQTPCPTLSMGSAAHICSSSSHILLIPQVSLPRNTLMEASSQTDNPN